MFLQALRVALGLALFKGEPADMPYSVTLPRAALALAVFSTALLLSPVAPLPMALATGVGGALGVAFFTRQLLRGKKLDNRYAQTVSAQLLMGSVFALALLPAMWAIAPSMQEMMALMRDRAVAAGPETDMLSVWTEAVQSSKQQPPAWASLWSDVLLLWSLVASVRINRLSADLGQAFELGADPALDFRADRLRDGRPAHRRDVLDLIMHLHILGICGTFMGGIAAIARERGHKVTGSDANAWPPMSTQLEALGIGLMQGYAPEHLQPAPDVVVVGNVVTRGNPAMEYVLNQGLPYVSGPQWLAENVLRDKHVLAVAGTHGKTTTTSLLAWMLEHAGLKPGFLIGGVPGNFGISARLGESKYFVIEADEYDTAFFDKRSKFVHYRPRTAILNNLEYDHADIFPDLAAIERQFHHLVRTVPGEGRLVVNGADANLARVLEMGCWSGIERFDDADGWQASGPDADGGFEVLHRGASQGRASLSLAGAHNRSNALAAIAAAQHIGVPAATATAALASFKGIRRRLELRGTVRGVEVYDDFAHHPTAIEVTVRALKEKGAGRILAVLEPRSNTMRLGSHKTELAHALDETDVCFVYAPPTLKWNAAEALAAVGSRLRLHEELGSLISAIAAEARPGDRVLVMSNGDFGGIHERLMNNLAA